MLWLHILHCKGGFILTDLALLGTLIGIHHAPHIVTTEVGDVGLAGIRDKGREIEPERLIVVSSMRSIRMFFTVAHHIIQAHFTDQTVRRSLYALFVIFAINHANVMAISLVHIIE